MAIPSSGPISADAIQTELGGDNPIGLDEYYRGGEYTSSNNTNVPTEGVIDYEDFYGAEAKFGTGGTTTIVDGYVYHTFTSSGSFVAQNIADAEYIIIGGGGAGGSTAWGGGGGAGDVIVGTNIPDGTHTVTVGAGAQSRGSRGGNSVFLSQTALGGGAGSWQTTGHVIVGGSSGGSGGGAGGAKYNLGQGNQGFAGVGVNANRGGNSAIGGGIDAGGGGGGAGGAGGNGSPSRAGAGGSGYTWVDGKVYAGGGGGYANGGGQAGGGSGQTNYGGGGNANVQRTILGGAVIIRYPE